MERSTEIEALVVDLFDAVSAGDAGIVDTLVTGLDGLVFIGTDPTEWFTEPASLRTLVESQAGAGVKVEPGDVRGYEEGTVGWAANQGAFVLPDGNRVPFRLTTVFHREGGAWKLVQEHCSVAASNEGGGGGGRNGSVTTKFGPSGSGGSRPSAVEPPGGTKLIGCTFCRSKL